MNAGPSSFRCDILHCSVGDPVLGDIHGRHPISGGERSRPGSTENQ